MHETIHGIDVARVSSWLVDNIDGATAPFRFDIIVGGRSNLTYTVTGADGTKYVLRRPPTGAVLATAHDMAREHKIISGVGKSDVPVPPALGLCVDDEVNGAPFYVMGFVDGVVLDSAEKGALLSIDHRRAAGFDLIDVLADLHAVDVDAVGLGDLAKREGYVERQVKRWSTQWERSKTRELPAVEEVARRLAERFPEQHGVSIAHGDYRFGNVLTDVAAGRINAVLDWELCTLGDPLADVGYVGVYWADPGSVQSRPNDPTGIEGFPSYSDLLERYATRTGRDLSEIDYYIAFGSFRLAVISEGVYARYLHGAMGDQAISDEQLNAFKVGTEVLAESALDAMRRL
ncbi:MAG TPA: phosphotransferase family protein [Ilumatobacteraceae bacterium]|nr:phosphotransferase family protein [Ilumatobacteraceae bacterium]